MKTKDKDAEKTGDGEKKSEAHVWLDKLREMKKHEHSELIDELESCAEEAIEVGVSDAVKPLVEFAERCEAGWRRVEREGFALLAEMRHLSEMRIPAKDTSDEEAKRLMIDAITKIAATYEGIKSFGKTMDDTLVALTNAAGIMLETARRAFRGTLETEGDKSSTSQAEQRYTRAFIRRYLAEFERYNKKKLAEYLAIVLHADDYLTTLELMRKMVREDNMDGLIALVKEEEWFREMTLLSTGRKA